MSKRAPSPPASPQPLAPLGLGGDTPPTKRARPDQALALVPQASQALVHATSYASSALVVREGSRTSTLPAPELTLTGHEAAVYTVAFSPNGDHLASAGLDRNIFLWDVFGEARNFNVLAGHKSAVLQVCWPRPQAVFSCSADKTAALWDPNTGTRVRKFSEHTGIVNALSAALQGDLFATASDDCSVILWDARAKQSVGSAFLDYQQLAVCLSTDGSQLYTAGIDNIVRRYDTRAGLTQPDLELAGCADSVTGLSLNAEGTSLLANSMDCHLHIFDVRPFSAAAAPGQGLARQRGLLPGVHHGAEKLLLRCSWSSDNDFVSAGSADRLVHLWDARGAEMCAWPGHKASVNEVAFHPSQPVLASASSDKTLVLGEFSPV